VHHPLMTLSRSLVRWLGALSVLFVLSPLSACSATGSGSGDDDGGAAGRGLGGRGNTGGSGGAAGFGGAGAGNTGGAGAGGGFGGSNGSGFGGSNGSGFGGSNGSGFGGSNGSGFGGSDGAGGASGGNGAGGSGTGGSGGAGATGGASGAGTGGAGGTGGGAVGGYMTFGDWHGFAWTAIGGAGNIMPPNFGTKTAPPLCATGDLAAGTANVGLLGVNLNQASAPNSPIMSVVPTLDGMNVSVTNNGTSQLRVQIQGPNGATDANDRWCAPIFGSGGFIPWNAFNTKCWDGTGTAYNRQPIVAAMILVPGATGAVSFNFCLNEIGAASDPGGPGGGGCSLTGSSGEGTGTITGAFDWKGVTRGGRNYVIQNNVWGGSSSQLLSYTGVSFSISQQTGNNPTNGQPISYPSVFIGSNNGRTTTGSNLPRRVGSLTSVQTGWSWSTNGASGNYNAAYDVWFSSGAGGDSGNPSGGYLMVWLYRPSSVQPIGPNPAAVVNLAGGTWDVWRGTQLGRPIVSYVRTQTTNSMSFDLNVFIKDAVSRGILSNEMYLTNVFAGFEVWSGGNGLRTDNFCTVVN
jgi:hypothetical protein